MNDKDKQLREWLLQLAQHNDHRSFRLLFESLYPELMRFALYYVKIRESAEEIIQDVFLKIWQIRATLLTILNFRAYLFTTTRNLCLNYLQKKSQSVPIYSDTAAESDLAVSDNDPQQALELVDMQHRIKTAVDTLPPQCRLIFQLVKEQGFSYREVADLLTISPRTVETQIGIALKKIAAALGSY
ncbi:RNA polymerase sigma-70 factor [Larkinella sp. GY13]|uniref:RNA polymerase sigma-70 factor n=1 Tax=Larkinella sp. GY13 TaxID=3453720 RepID=UPI003EE89A28